MTDNITIYFFVEEFCSSSSISPRLSSIIFQTLSVIHYVQRVSFFTSRKVKVIINQVGTDQTLYLNLSPVLTCCDNSLSSRPITL